MTTMFLFYKYYTFGPLFSVNLRFYWPHYLSVSKIYWPPFWYYQILLDLFWRVEHLFYLYYPPPLILHEQPSSAGYVACNSHCPCHLLLLDIHPPANAEKGQTFNTKHGDLTHEWHTCVQTANWACTICRLSMLVCMCISSLPNTSSEQPVVSNRLTLFTVNDYIHPFVHTYFIL